MTVTFPEFQNRHLQLEVEDGVIEVSCLIGGNGPPLLLLHGFPQTKAIWHRIAPQLAQSYTVIAPDLRGYGQSSKPQSSPDHKTYSKKVMAGDQLALMNALGFYQFYVLGHDRGARVAHRLAVDYPQNVLKLMLLDISPTLTMYSQTTMSFAKGYWHWFFLTQAHPIPEKMIGANPEFWLRNHMGRYAGTNIFAPECWQEYLEGVSDPVCLEAMCEDYRAAATIDLIDDQRDRDRQHRLTMPVHVLWGEHGLINQCFKPLKDWAEVAQTVSGHAVPSGHYIPEEIPDLLRHEAKEFFK
jgi:haloacetate dehalogenase